jgi:hypothetical protein
MRHATRGVLVAVATGALLLSACSKSTTTAQTTGTPGDASVAGTDAPPADAMAIDTPIVDYPGVEHLHFSYGPLDVLPGQNNIEISGKKVPKPDVDGYIVGIRPNLRHPDGSVPGVDVIHLHHGVWLNASAKDSTSALPERLFATGEEKTIFTMPQGYGYAYKATDKWIINYMTRCR